MRAHNNTNRRAFGELQERIAAHYLTNQGLQLICMNYRCRLGEIDLIMRGGVDLIFVEVRYRKSSRWGTAAETVDYRKQSKLVRAAQFFVSSHNLASDTPCRFDVLGLSPGPGPEQLNFDWIKGAFLLTSI